MESDFKLVGLTKNKSFTLEGPKHRFWATCEWPDEKFMELFKWAKNTPGFWSDHSWRATVKYHKTADDGTPINPIVVSINEV